MQLGLGDERTGFRLQFLQSRLEQRQRCIIETRPDVGSERELAAFPGPDQHRAERAARTFSLRVAADHELAAVERLDLEPRSAALAGLIAAALALADHAFEAGVQRGAVQRDSVFGRDNELHARRRQQTLRQIPAPVRVGCVAQVGAGEVQQIEAVEDCALVNDAAILHRVETRLAVGVERDDLAVEDHRRDILLREFSRRASGSPPRARARRGATAASRCRDR